MATDNHNERRVKCYLLSFQNKQDETSRRRRRNEKLKREKKTHTHTHIETETDAHSRIRFTTINNAEITAKKIALAHTNIYSTGCLFGGFDFMRCAMVTLTSSYIDTLFFFFLFSLVGSTLAKNSGWHQVAWRAKAYIRYFLPFFFFFSFSLGFACKQKL